MTISLQPTTLDTPDGDAEAVLVYRENRLLAVASRLGPAHEADAGSWFLEAVFGPRDLWTGTSFVDEAGLAAWAASVDAQPPMSAQHFSGRGA